LTRKRKNSSTSPRGRTDERRSFIRISDEEQGFFNETAFDLNALGGSSRRLGRFGKKGGRREDGGRGFELFDHSADAGGAGGLGALSSGSFDGALLRMVGRC
jgi:hypothetical protein